MQWGEAVKLRLQADVLYREARDLHYAANAKTYEADQLVRRANLVFEEMFRAAEARSDI